MIEGPSINVWAFLRLLTLALVLWVTVRGLRFGLQIAPMSASRRRGLERAMPMVELLVWVLFLLSAVQIVFARVPELAAVGVLGILFGGLWLARHALMDLIAGVFLRTNGSVAKGDRVRVDGLDGQITWLGSRNLAVTTERGEEALIPYSRMAGQSVVRTPRVDGAHRHAFLIEGTEAGPGAAADRIRQLAMLCHWSSVARVPVVTVDGDHLSVTVFALEPDRGAEIEAFVRKALRSST